MAASQTTAATNTAATSLLIYDGDCGFCTQAARKFVVLGSGLVTTAPWQTLQLADYGLTEHDCSQAAFFVAGDDVHRGAAAVAYGLKACPRPWSLLGTALAVPPLSWLSRAIYPMVARYRHKLPGATDACRIG